MNKRNLATVLWFFMGWTIGSVIAFVIGLPTLVGGVPLAFASAALIRAAGQRLWRIETAAPQTSASLAARAPLATE